MTFEATDANDLPATGAVTLEIASPDIPIDALTSPFLLTGPTLTEEQLGFLDYQGNGVAGYDIGDFRAWVLAHPGLPLSAVFEASPGPRTVVIPMRLATEGRSR